MLVNRSIRLLMTFGLLVLPPVTIVSADQEGVGKDGLFDQLDIVAALQTGNYLQGP